MTDTKLTAEMLDAQERMAKEATAMYGRTSVRVNAGTLLSLIAAARASLESRGDAATLLKACRWMYERGHKSAATDLDYNWNDTDQPGNGSCLPLHQSPSAAVVESMAGWERVPSLPLDKSAEINLPDSDVWVLISTEDGSDMLMAKSEWTDDSEGNGEPYWEADGGDLALCNYPFWRPLPSPPKVAP